MSVTTASLRVDWEVHEVFQIRRSCVAGGARVAAVQTKEFFLEVFMHFRSAGTLVWNAMETT
jgi:hypothetical protein